MGTIGYTLPEYNSVVEEDFNWHAAKLAEECGEVCQVICKRNNLGDAALECIDVIQCAENILRKIGVTDKMLDQMRSDHAEKDKRRGYLKEANIFDKA